MTFSEIIKIKSSGIYKITNKISQHSYIGQAKNIGARIKSHVHSSCSPTSKDYDYPLHIAFRKYGLDNFEFDILEQCNTEELNNKEIY